MIVVLLYSASIEAHPRTFRLLSLVLSRRLSRLLSKILDEPRMDLKVNRSSCQHSQSSEVAMTVAARGAL